MTLLKREPLSRDRVAAAALDLIDGNGLDSVSMRKVGAALGFEAMSLYNHVDSKDDMFSAVADRLYGEVIDAYGQPEGDWRSKARAMTSAYISVADVHPNAVSLMVDRPVDSTPGIEFMSRILEIFEEVTTDTRTAALAFTVISSWVIGTISQEHGAMRRLHAGDQLDDPDAPPEVQRVSRFREVWVDELTAEERFSEGLEAILDGMEQRYFSG